MQTVWIALAGAVGAAARYRIGVAVGVRSFPWATPAINVGGSFLLALLIVGPWSARWSPSTTNTIGIGLLGAFTTFSTFGYEAFTLARTGREQLAIVYVVLSIVGGVGAAALGYLVGRALS